VPDCEPSHPGRRTPLAHTSSRLRSRMCIALPTCMSLEDVYRPAPVCIAVPHLCVSPLYVYGFAVISEGSSTAPFSLRSLSCEEDPTRTLYLPGTASHWPVDSLK
jgi:hypothetical protein